MDKVLLIIIALAIIFVGPWLTWLSFNELVTDPTFDIGGWFSALWLMIAFGGISAATK